MPAVFYPSIVTCLRSVCLSLAQILNARLFLVGKIYQIIESTMVVTRAIFFNRKYTKNIITCYLKVLTNWDTFLLKQPVKPPFIPAGVTNHN